MCEKTIGGQIIFEEDVNLKDRNDVEIIFAGIDKEDELSPALSIVNNILGGNNQSKLFKKIREQMGLTYDIYSTKNKQLQKNIFSIRTNIGSENIQKLINAIVDILADLLQNGILNEKELVLQKKKKEIADKKITDDAKFILHDNFIGRLSNDRSRILERGFFSERFSKISMSQITESLRTVLSSEPVVFLYGVKPSFGLDYKTIKEMFKIENLMNRKIGEQTNIITEKYEQETLAKPQTTARSEGTCILM